MLKTFRIIDVIFLVIATTPGGKNKQASKKCSSYCLFTIQTSFLSVLYVQINISKFVRAYYHYDVIATLIQRKKTRMHTGSKQLKF